MIEFCEKLYILSNIAWPMVEWPFSSILTKNHPFTSCTFDHISICIIRPFCQSFFIQYPSFVVNIFLNSELFLVRTCVYMISRLRLTQDQARSTSKKTEFNWRDLFTDGRIGHFFSNIVDRKLKFSKRKFQSIAKII